MRGPLVTAARGEVSRKLSCCRGLPHFTPSLCIPGPVTFLALTPHGALAQKPNLDLRPTPAAGGQQAKAGMA